MTPGLVSIILVTYNSQGDVWAAAQSGLEAVQVAHRQAELIIVDNASTDETTAIVDSSLREARLIRNRENLGFGVANNQAFEIAMGEYLLLLNPDARLDPGAIVDLADVLDRNERVAGAAPSIRGPGRVESAGFLPGLRSLAGHYFFLNRLFPNGRGGPWRGFAIPRGRAGPTRVEWVSAAAVLLRASAVRAVNGFDARIFLYGEDIDLCSRLNAAGQELWLVPSATAVHRIGGSQPEASTRWVDGLHAYYSRRASRPKLVAFDLILATGLGVRALANVGSSRQGHRRRMRAAAKRAAQLAAGAGTSPAGLLPHF